MAKKGHPGGAWFLPALEACKVKIDGNSTVNGLPLPKDIDGLHRLITRYSEALRRERNSVCVWEPLCKHFQDMLAERKIENTLWDYMTREQQLQFTEEALGLLQKYLP